MQCLFEGGAYSGAALINNLLSDEVFATSGIIKVKVTVISRRQRLRLRLITVTETLIIPDIAKIYCFIIHCFTGKQNKGKQFQHLCPSCLPASERFFP